MNFRSFFLATFLGLTTYNLPAIQVDPETGNDANDGVAAPVKSIAKAISLAKAGDTVHLKPATYYEGVNLTGKMGEPGKPITVDGHGAILEGSDAIRAEEWESLGGGLYRKVALIPRMVPSILGRWFFLWDGKMNRMGRTSKAAGAALKKVEDLNANEWTYVQTEDAFYIKVPERIKLTEANIRYPLRVNGVTMAGKGGHLVVKNITATHVYNDGFNIHGDQVDTVFENITALECGDDGFSAHETAECRINGFVSIGNSTGLCDVNVCVTHYKNVYIRNCHAFDIYLIGATHSMENVLVESTAVYPLTLGPVQHEKIQCQVNLKNLQIRRMSPKEAEVRVNRNANVVIDRATFIGLNMTVAPGGEINLTNSAIKEGMVEPTLMIFHEATWKGSNNRFELKSLRKGPDFFNPKTFADFQKKYGCEAGSQWVTVDPGVGGDAAILREVEEKGKVFSDVSP
jgi:hypothetical protein